MMHGRAMDGVRRITMGLGIWRPYGRITRASGRPARVGGEEGGGEDHLVRRPRHLRIVEDDDVPPQRRPRGRMHDARSCQPTRWVEPNWGGGGHAKGPGAPFAGDHEGLREEEGEVNPGGGAELSAREVGGGGQQGVKGRGPWCRPGLGPRGGNPGAGIRCGRLGFYAGVNPKRKSRDW